MTIEQLLADLTEKKAVFTDVLAFIDANYDFTETAFKNGEQTNAVGENSGSCRVFSVAKLHNLSAESTLALFAEHYADVLSTPEADNHQNIRQFMQHGWDGIQFDGNPLSAKN